MAKPGDPDDFAALGLEPGDLPAGFLVGTVEIADCTGDEGEFEWQLRKPERLPRVRRPKNQAQPVFFNPF